MILRKLSKYTLGISAFCLTLMPIQSFAEERVPLTAQSKIMITQSVDAGIASPSLKITTPESNSEAKTIQKSSVIFSPAFTAYSTQEKLQSITQFYEEQNTLLKKMKESLHVAVSNAELQAYKENVQSIAKDSNNSYAVLFTALSASIEAGEDVNDYTEQIFTIIQENRTLLKELSNIIEIKSELTVSKTNQMEKRTGTGDSEKESKAVTEETLPADAFLLHEEKAYVSLESLKKLSQFTINTSENEWSISTGERVLKKSQSDYSLNGKYIGQPAIYQVINEADYVQFDMLLSLLGLTFKETDKGIVLKDKFMTNNQLDSLDVETFKSSIQK